MPRNKEVVDAALQASLNTQAHVANVMNAVMPFIGNLADRWDDEQKYEDIADYQNAIQTRLPKGYAVTRITKKPFGFEFTYKNLRYGVKCTPRQIKVVMYNGN